MKFNHLLMTLAFIASTGALTACAQTSMPQDAQAPAATPAATPAAGAGAAAGATAAATAATAPAPSPPPSTAVAAPDTGLPTVLVHKNASCGCCNAWVDHLRQQGFSVQVRDVDDMGPVKQRLGIPFGKGSCHTAEVGGYFVEGHVPAADIKRLLADKPAAKGLVLPGMPLGSPGMEVPDKTVQPYTVELVQGDGTTREYSRHGAD